MCSYPCPKSLGIHVKISIHTAWPLNSQERKLMLSFCFIHSVIVTVLADNFWEWFLVNRVQIHFWTVIKNLILPSFFLSGSTVSFSLHTDIEKVMLFISTVFKFNSETYSKSESVNKTAVHQASSHPRRSRMKQKLTCFWTIDLLEALGVDMALR